MLTNYHMLADYNAWANRLVYAAAADLSEAELNRDTGAFFGSIFGTLSHVITADRIWLNRFTGEGPRPQALDERPYDRFEDLRAARINEDERIVRYMRGLTPDDIEGNLTYAPVSSTEIIHQKLWPALTHFFNHQTHHRGQVHAGLTMLGKPSLSIDLIYFVRSDGKAYR